jgi:hypothetical protein
MLIINYGCLTPFANFSNTVKKQTSEKSQLMKQIRKDLYRQRALNFINFKSDTVYVVSMWDYESGFIYGKIWNRKGNVNYSYGQGKIQIRNDNYPFKEEAIIRINAWDKNELLDSHPQGVVLPSYTIEAVRVIIIDQKVNVDTISFKY